MARAVSHPFGLLLDFAPCVHSSPSCSWYPHRSVSRPQRSPPNLRCSVKSNSVEPPVSPPSTDASTVKPEPVKDDIETSSVSQNVEFEEFPNKSINRRIALASTVSAVGLFLSSRLDFGVSLKDLSASAIPYEEALSNGLPTVVEFYADWCEVCRELAPDVYKVEQQYR
ncbi:uncharacterized protein A4U43_C05F4060 [Asparagus officinalis]|uniref:Thioredoxin domain-containing protein n=1 Tax=Asparagus officinalis TaxID=4686 RepID=A0A5P1EPU0_ASPOF|nr:thioredoxin-like protein HCF164, chloroplastic [Asparagus officinalis]ONK67814.1 uncharacterized protein A4U43_C05F4060 [Asparagus officinalis]